MTLYRSVPCTRLRTEMLLDGVAVSMKVQSGACECRARSPSLRSPCQQYLPKSRTHLGKRLENCGSRQAPLLQK